jgi:hypothetical protein
VGPPEAAPEAAPAAKNTKKKKSVSFAVCWPGEKLDDWCDATRAALTPAAALVQAVFVRFDADRDGALCTSELNALNNATGSGALEPDDLDYLFKTFHATAAGMSAQGLDEYFLDALKDDLADALKDLRSFKVHAA